MTGGHTHPVSTWPVALASYAVPATAKMLDAVLAHGWLSRLAEIMRRNQMTTPSRGSLSKK